MNTAMARGFRHRAPAAERLLWEAVRGRRLAGLKFRRQVPIDRYVVDFACHELHLVVELDGPWHDEVRDQARTQVIEAAGWHVLRIASQAVVEARGNALAEILRHVAQTRPPPPPRIRFEDQCPSPDQDEDSPNDREPSPGQGSDDLTDWDAYPGRAVGGAKDGEPSPGREKVARSAG